jgi:hypothetical protein
MGRPCLWPPPHVSLPEAMDTTHSALHQVWYVIQWERDDLEAEQQRLKKWGSLLKTWTRFEQQKAVAKRVQLDAMEEVLKAKHVTIGKLD